MGRDLFFESLAAGCYQEVVQILFENQNFVFVDKPAEVLSTPSRDAHDPRPCLGRELQNQLGMQIYPVHRLDFEVSGLVLFAKTATAHRLAQSWFEHARVQKIYQAISASLPGEFPVDWVDWRSKLVRGKRRSFPAPHGKDSWTRARVVDPARRLWELQPVTGRPHQLRVEMHLHGHPIEGDVLYGAPPRAQAGIALRAVSLDFSRIAERCDLPEKVEAPKLLG